MTQVFPPKDMARAGPEGREEAAIKGPSGEPRPQPLPHSRADPAGRALHPGLGHLGHHVTCTPTRGMKALSQPLPQTHKPHQGPFSEDGMPAPSPVPCPATRTQPTPGSVLQKTAQGGLRPGGGGRISNTRLSAALGLCFCCWGEIREPQIPSYPLLPSPGAAPSSPWPREASAKMPPAVGSRQKY